MGVGPPLGRPSQAANRIFTYQMDRVRERDAMGDMKFYIELSIRTQFV